MAGRKKEPATGRKVAGRRDKNATEGKGSKRTVRQPVARSGKPLPKVQKQMVETACISRGPHDKSCLCGGTGKIKTLK